MNTTESEHDGRLSFMEAVAFAMQKQQASFSAMPVFGDRTDDAEQTAEGTRIFIVEPDPDSRGNDWRMRFIAGPFFSNAYAANEILGPAEVPENVRELRFMPTQIDDKWFDEQIQILVQQLVKGAGLVSGQMPDYSSMPSHQADAQTVFPVSFIGREGGSAH